MIDEINELLIKFHKNQVQRQTQAVSGGKSKKSATAKKGEGGKPKVISGGKPKTVGKSTKSKKSMKK